MSAMTQTPYTLPSREDSAKSRYTITPPPPDYTDDADGMRWYPCDGAVEIKLSRLTAGATSSMVWSLSPRGRFLVDMRKRFAA